MTHIERNDNRIVPKPGRTPTVFRCAASNAKSVFLAGDFNGWSDYATPVQRSPDGFWTVAIALPPGRYEFKFVVDGHWCNGDGGDGPWCNGSGGDGPYDGRDNCLANPFGSMNRVINVGQEDENPEFQLGAIGTEVTSRSGQRPSDSTPVSS